jgi:hypothetical protein
LAVGVITEFQPAGQFGTAGSDPCGVTSLVKVSGQWGSTSNWIPLFFCPKKQYWDNPDVGYEMGVNGPPVLYDRPAHQAQDFNKDGNYYEKAWMSFRPGDSVIVACQTDKDGGNITPLYVLGFVDIGGGTAQYVPRVGEDVIKWIFKGVIGYYQVSINKTYNGSDANALGPDGLKLNLLTQCKIVRLPDSGTMTIANYSTYVNGVYFADKEWDTDTGEVLINVAEEYDIWYRTTMTVNYSNFAILCPVGPLLYCFTFCVAYTWFNTTIMAAYKTGTYDDPPWSSEAWHQPGYDPATEWPGNPPDGSGQIPWATVPNPPPEMQYYQTYFSATPPPPPYGNPRDSYSMTPMQWGVTPVLLPVWAFEPPSPQFPTVVLQVTGPDPFPIENYSAGVGNFGPNCIPFLPIMAFAQYSEELISNPLANPPTVGFQNQPYFDIMEDLATQIESITGDSKASQALLNNPDSMLQCFVRPHTKAELQAAGLWPFNN